MAWPAVAAASLALGQVTVVFRDGESPAPSYAGTRDISIWEESGIAWNPDANYDNLDDQVGGSPENASTLLKFDLSSVAPSTTLQGASLELSISTDSDGEVYPVYQCLQPWTSAGATWNRYDGVSAWSVPGASGAPDRGTTAVAALSPTSSGSLTVPLTDAGVGLAQGWISGAITNNGLIIQKYDNTEWMVLDRFGGGDPLDWPALRLSLTDGGTITVNSGWDTTIANGSDPASNANGDDLEADGDSPAAMLISWDVSAIPPWSTVSAASLLLDCSSTDDSYSVYESLRPWVETEATWNNYASGSPWGAPGADGPGDHGATVLGVLTGSDAVQVALNAAGVQLVQSWVRGSIPNRGLEIVEYNMVSDGIGCEDSEDDDLEQRPGLQVTYTEGQLAFLNAPISGGVDAALGPFTLQRRRVDGVPIATGAPAVSMTATASSPSAGFAGDPGATTWTPSWSVTFPAGSATSDPFWLRDSIAGRPTVTVSGGAAWQAVQQVESVRTVRVSLTASTVPAGGSVTATVQAVDSADVTSAANLSARLVNGLPQPDGATFSAVSVGTPGGTSASGTASGGAATFTIQGDNPESLLFCASITSAPASEQCTPVTFGGGVPDHLRLTLARAGAQSPIAGCTPEDLLVQLVDSTDGPVSQPQPITLCADAAGALVLGPSTLGSESRAGGCVSGTLGAGGNATLTVWPTAPTGVSFSVDSPAVSNGSVTLPVQWIAGPPSLRATGMAPRDGTAPLVLEEGGEAAYVRLTPRDDCGFLPITSSITVSIPTPAVAGSVVLDVDAGTADFPISLPECPSVVQSLFILARVNGELLVTEDGGARSLQVDLKCHPRVQTVGCGCGSGPSSGPGAAALLLGVALAALARVKARRVPVPEARRAGHFGVF